MAARDRKSRPSLQILTAAALTALITGYGIAEAVRQSAAAGPQVGDIVSFDSPPSRVFDGEARLIAVRPRDTNCVLDVAVIQQSGGSLVLEQRDAGPHRLYHVHWAGPRTSEGVTDCGHDADLVISGPDMHALISAARGTGADGFPVMALR